MASVVVKLKSMRLPYNFFPKVATGSPFKPVRVGNRDVLIGQGNNAFIFPGLGFGSILAHASEITDAMVLEAAYALAEYTMTKHADSGVLYPPVSELRNVALEVATRVIRRAFTDGVARSKKVTPERAAALGGRLAGSLSKDDFEIVGEACGSVGRSL